jgi:hypothetical protein
MPPERERQLEALRRYVETLGASDEEVTAPRRRSPWGRVLLVGVLSLLLLVAGIGIGRAVQPDRPEPAAAQTATVDRSATPECKTAVDRANHSLTIAAQVENALEEHTEYMNQLLHGQISGSVALKKGMPSLITGARASSRFDAALADYKDVVSRCRLRELP